MQGPFWNMKLAFQLQAESWSCQSHEIGAEKTKTLNFLGLVQSAKNPLVDYLSLYLVISKTRTKNYTNDLQQNEFNIWIQFLFNPENRDANVATLIKCDTPHLMKFDTSIFDESGPLERKSSQIVEQIFCLFEYARSKTSKSNRYRRGVLFRFASGQFSAPKPPVSPDLWGCKNSLCGNRTLPGCSIWIPFPLRFELDLKIWGAGQILKPTASCLGVGPVQMVLALAWSERVTN